MSGLPNPDVIARVVSLITETMLGRRLSLGTDSMASPDLQWRSAALPIPGQQPLTLLLSSDRTGCSVLGAAMFSCAPEEADMSMIDDTLCELANMTAGRLKSAIGLDQALGLPRILTAESEPAAMHPARTLVMTDSSMKLMVRLCDQVI